jgi:hypothetical protein
MREAGGGAIVCNGHKYMMSNVARNQTRVYATRLVLRNHAFVQVSPVSEKEDTP